MYIPIRKLQDRDESISSFDEDAAGCPSIQDNKRVAELARYIQQRHPNLRGFTRASLFRMEQFYDTYRHDRKVAPLVRQLPWSHNLIILGRPNLRQSAKLQPESGTAVGRND